MQDCFFADILKNRNNRAILDRWERLALPDGWLADSQAGAHKM